jgi:MSHA pilin protein MshA
MSADIKEGFIMRKQSGFTLIELIIVIVILGILAVTAAPRFIDLQSDAKAATLEGVKAALQGGSQLVYAKAAIQGEQGKASGSVSIAGVTGNISTVNGYPDANSFTHILAASGSVTSTDLSAFAEIDEAEFDIVQSAATTDGSANSVAGADGEFVITFQGGQDGDACTVRYRNSAGVGQAPIITVETPTSC